MKALGRDVGIYLGCNKIHTVTRRLFRVGYGDERWIQLGKEFLARSPTEWIRGKDRVQWKCNRDMLRLIYGNT
jgi:hypothetical protein